MIQIHLLGQPLSQAHGVVGQLDIEWVHFLWNSAVLLAVVNLVVRYRREPWLWISVAAAGWHQVEHVYLMAIYLETGVQGTPGLLATGGRIGGGLPLSRPDLHFLYNVVETAPLFVAFARTIRQRPDASTCVARATTEPVAALREREDAVAGLERAA